MARGRHLVATAGRWRIAARIEVWAGTWAVAGLLVVQLHGIYRAVLGRMAKCVLRQNSASVAARFGKLH